MAHKWMRMKVETCKRVPCRVLEKNPNRCTIMVFHLITEGIRTTVNIIMRFNIEPRGAISDKRVIRGLLNENAPIVYIEKSRMLYTLLKQCIIFFSTIQVQTSIIGVEIIVCIPIGIFLD